MTLLSKIKEPFSRIYNDYYETMRKHQWYGVLFLALMYFFQLGIFTAINACKYDERPVHKVEKVGQNVPNATTEGAKIEIETKAKEVHFSGTLLGAFLVAWILTQFLRKKKRSKVFETWISAFTNKCPPAVKPKSWLSTI